MSRYAQGTSVETQSSVGEIERTLLRYGANGFQYGWSGDLGFVEFLFSNRRIRLTVPIPQRDSSEFRKTPTGRERSDSAAAKAWEQARRQRWRALALAVKAKLEVVESGIRTFDQEFGMDIVLPDGRTVFDHVTDQLSLGTPPRLQLTSGGQS